MNTPVLCYMVPYFLSTASVLVRVGIAFHGDKVAGGETLGAVRNLDPKAAARLALEAAAVSGYTVGALSVVAIHVAVVVLLIGAGVVKALAALFAVEPSDHVVRVACRDISSTDPNTLS